MQAISVLEQRLHTAEQTLDEALQIHDKHAKDLEYLQALQGKLTQELRAQEVGNATLFENLQAANRKLMDDLSTQESSRAMLAERVNNEVEAGS